MDIARPDVKRQKTVRRYIYVGAALFAVVAVTAHLWTSHATMDVAPSIRHAFRRSSSATAARSRRWCADTALWCWDTLATRDSVRRDTMSGRGPSLRVALTMAPV